MRSVLSLSRSAVTLAALAALWSVAARAQADATVTASSSDAAPQGALGGVRLRYGPSFRSGNYLDNTPNPTLSYSGMTPNDFALGGEYFPMDLRPLLVGGDVRLQREGFSLNDSGQKVTSGSLLRVAAGPAGRFSFGPLKLDAMVNYAFAQLPGFVTSSAPAFTPATRHSLLLAARGHFDLPFGALVEASAEYPIALAVKDDAGGSGKSTGFAAGASLGYRVYTSGRMGLVALADYQYVSDSLTAANGTTASQTLHRVGLALEVDYLEPPPPPAGPRTGTLLVTVLDEATQKPLENVGVDVEAGGQRYTLTTAADGKASKADLPVGSIVAKATAGGYLPAEGSGVVKAGEDTPLELRVKKEPPKSGGLNVTFVDKETQAPLGGVKVIARDQEYLADDSGALSLVDLPPGPVELKASKDGYRPGAEVASVVAGQKSPVQIALVKAERKQPATVKGIVRGTQTGAAVAATLEIPEAKIKVKVDAQGSFSVPLPQGGTYRVIISAPGYLTQTKSVTVKEGDEVIFNVDLHPVGR